MEHLTDFPDVPDADLEPLIDVSHLRRNQKNNPKPQKRKSTSSASAESAPKRPREMKGKEAHRQFWMEEFGRTPQAWDRHEARRGCGGFDDGGSQDDSDRGSGFDSFSSSEDLALDDNEDDGSSSGSDVDALRKTVDVASF